MVAADPFPSQDDRQPRVLLAEVNQPGFSDASADTLNVNQPHRCCYLFMASFDPFAVANLIAPHSDSGLYHYSSLMVLIA